MIQASEFVAVETLFAFVTDSKGGVASGRAPHEAASTMQKFIRAGFGTNYIDNCSRA